jgi:hypothetical protein
MGIKLINRFQENILLTFCISVKCVNTVFFINFQIVVRLLRVAFFHKFVNKSLNCVCSNW